MTPGPSPDEVAISGADGTVVLRGTVGSFSQRRAAVSDARKTDAVYDVDDQIAVRLLNDDRREDADIRGTALQILTWDTRKWLMTSAFRPDQSAPAELDQPVSRSHSDRSTQSSAA